MTDIRITQTDIMAYLKNNVQQIDTTLSLEERARVYVEELKGEAKPKNIAEQIFDNFANNLGRKNHEAWMRAKMANGYVYGEVVDDEKKTSNLLVDFDLLPKTVREDNVRNARETLKNVVKAGFEIHQSATEEQLKELVFSMAVSLHDEWARDKALKGYIFAEQRNDNPEAGPLTHRDMMSFNDLVMLYPEDAAYDINTAIGAISGLMLAGFVICVPNTSMAVC